MDNIPQRAVGKYGEPNSLNDIEPIAQHQGCSLVVSAHREEEGDIIDLCRSYDSEGNEYWALTLEEKRVALSVPVGKKQIAPIIKQRNISDGWSIPFPTKPRPAKEEGKKTAAISYDYSFMALGEDVTDLYNKEYNGKEPVLCIRKRPLDIENPSNNAWVGNLQSEPKPKKKVKKSEKTQNEEEEGTKNSTEQVEEPVDSRLGITFVYEPHTGRKYFHLSDWKDDCSWAETYEFLATRMYPDADRIHVVVCKEDVDKIGTLELTCKADEALGLALKIETHAVPDSGRWLNFSENEAIMVCRQCLLDGVSSVEQVAEHLHVWQNQKTFVDLKLTLSGFREIFSDVYKPKSDFST